MHRNSARVSIITIAVTAALSSAAFAHPGEARHDAVHAARADVAPRGHAPVIVYVNRNGGTVSAGEDDSRRGTSSLVESGSVKVPPWKGGDARWKKVMACARDRFSAFDIELVEERPQSGDYIEALVGGMPSLLGYGKDVSGIAPYTGDVMPNAIVYIFAAGVDYDVEVTCVDVLHEVGHALGLDHEYLCQDPMSYLWDCDQAKTFQDVEAQCGEDDPRSCENGTHTQNSFRILARNVGLRGGRTLPGEDTQVASAAPPPSAAPDPSGEADDDGASDTTSLESTGPAPASPASSPDDELGVTVDGPQGVAHGDRMVTVTVHGRGAHLADAALAWVSPDGKYTLDCASMPAGGAATCRRRGDDFVFRLDVGVGWRYFAAVVVAAGGDTATSEPSSVYFQ
jgi:hypothetical protein